MTRYNLLKYLYLIIGTTLSILFTIRFDYSNTILLMLIISSIYFMSYGKIHIAKYFSSASQPKSIQNDTAKNKKKLPNILSVEDDPDITKIIDFLLEDKAIIWSAPNLKVANELLEKQSFDLIILDLKLPDGHGTTLLPCINLKTKKSIPVIVFSAYELEKKYMGFVKSALLKSKISNEKLFSIINTVIQENQ